MINFIVAIDEKRGLADEQGIPWDLPTDRRYFRNKTEFGDILMGYGTYIEFDEPLNNRINYVATNTETNLKKGFKKVADAREFLAKAKINNQEVWVIGGAGLFKSTIDYADKLYLTIVHGDFNCTKFFPDYTLAFDLSSNQKPITENNITFHFEVWSRQPNTK